YVPCAAATPASNANTTAPTYRRYDLLQTLMNAPRQRHGSKAEVNSESRRSSTVDRWRVARTAIFRENGEGQAKNRYAMSGKDPSKLDRILADARRSAE